VLIDDDRDDIEVALRAARREQLPVVITVFHDGSEMLSRSASSPRQAQWQWLGAPAPARDLPRPAHAPDRRLGDPRPAARQSAHARIPVIVQSWSTRREDIERCYALGANSFVAKRMTPSNRGHLLRGCGPLLDPAQPDALFQSDRMLTAHAELSPSARYTASRL
jgi:CheY-like chemotaxis protein